MNEMKNIYVAPQMEVIEIENEIAMMALSADDALPGTTWGGSTEGGNEMEADANGRRGSWGNLWEDGRRW